MNKRNKLLKQLITYAPSSKREQVCLNQMTTFVAQNERYDDRELEIGHVTGSAWLLNHTGDKVLLTHHRKLDMWLQLGGHSEGEDDIIDVALREAVEESGIKNIAPLSDKIFDIDVHPFPEKDNFPEHLHFDIRYLLQVSEPSDQYVISDESHDLQWVSYDQSKNLVLDPSVERMFKKCFGGKKRAVSPRRK